MDLDPVDPNNVQDLTKQLYQAIISGNESQVLEILPLIPIETVITDTGMTVFNFVCVSCENETIV